MSNLMTDEEIIVARTTSVLRSPFRYFRKHVSYTRTYLIDTCICVRNTNIQLSVNAIFLSSCTFLRLAPEIAGSGYPCHKIPPFYEHTHAISFILKIAFQAL